MFITQTGPKKSKEVQSEIRKHVMKDIGQARRKDGKRVIPIRFDLEVPDWLEHLSSLPGVESQSSVELLNEPRNVGDYTVNRNNFISSERDSRYDEIDHFTQQQAAQPGSVIVPSIERLGSGRLDPFFKYPIKMDKYTLRLMDHGNPNPIPYSGRVDIDNSR